MSRAARLLDLIQLLRRHRRPVTAATLAAELGVSERTVYRDVATLAAQGVPVEGEAGVGYVLRPGFLLPPLMFDEEEIDALVLGLRWAAGPRRREVGRRGGARHHEGRGRPAARRAGCDAPFRPDRRRSGRCGRGRSEYRGTAPGNPARVQAAYRLFRCGGGAPRGARSGPSRSAFSNRSGCWPHGANSARISGISAPTGSPRPNPCPSATRGAGPCCWRSGASRRACPNRSDRGS